MFKLPRTTHNDLAGQFWPVSLEFDTYAQNDDSS